MYEFEKKIELTINSHKYVSLYLVITLITLKHIHLWQINLIFTIITLSIYKSYITSNQRSDTINILGIFLYELNNMKEYFVYKKIKTNFLKHFITQF